MRRMGFLGTLMLVLCAGGLWSRGIARAEDEKEKEETKKRVLLSSLKDTAERCALAREQPVVSKCSTCSGTGKQKAPKLDSRGNVSGTKDVPCTRCDATGHVIDWTRAERAYWDCYTRAYRAVPANRTKFEETVKAWAKDPKKEPVLTNHKVKDARLVGEWWGVAFVVENEKDEARETRWMHGRDSLTNRPGWWIWDEKADGPWASSAAVEVEGEELARLKNLLRLAGVSHGIEDASYDGATFVIRLFSPAVTNEAELQAAIVGDIVPASRAGLKFHEKCGAVRLLFLARWRNKLGEVAKGPYEVAEIERSVFDRIVFENLLPEEVLQLYTRNRPVRTVEILWWK